MNICVFCSVTEVTDAYRIPAREFVRLVASRGHTFVWGGSKRGLMGFLADEVRNGGGKVIGILTEGIKEQEYDGADEMVITPDLATRKTMLLDRSDAFVVLVGGSGTLDEFATVLALKRHKLHRKPIVVLNTGGFYDHLKAQFERMTADGMTKPSVLEYDVYFASAPDEAMRYIESHAN